MHKPARFSRTSPVLLAVVVSLASVAGAAEIYLRKDSNKTPLYTDRPEPGAELINTTKPRPLQPQPAPAAPPRSTAAATGTAPQAEAAAAVQRDLAATRPEQCKQATDDYNKAIRARRMTRPAANGQVEFLSDAEITAERVKLQVQVQELCGNGR